jgi:hypothetical protein
LHLAVETVFLVFRSQFCYLIYMHDEIIDAVLARGLHADACRRHPLVGWIVMKDPPDYASKFSARLVTDAPTPYVLVADTLAEIHARLPPMLERSGRSPDDLPEVVEIWFSR